MGLEKKMWTFIKRNETIFLSKWPWNQYNDSFFWHVLFSHHFSVKDTKVVPGWGISLFHNKSLTWKFRTTFVFLSILLFSILLISLPSSSLLLPQHNWGWGEGGALPQTSVSTSSRVFPGGQGQHLWPQWSETKDGRNDRTPRGSLFSLILHSLWNPHKGLQTRLYYPLDMWLNVITLHLWTSAFSPNETQNSCSTYLTGLLRSLLN